ncbi:hypothetical protein BDZ91DRAFT_725792 [Kalaharituber pfeilii]|nr:hypothetical protein BDZ91DRAFT_725792 [Kalaharituber pfeilii]
MAGSAPPSSKEKKYDRQLRLWGANGQQALEASHICLVNATATGCEVLKNLILPGIGKFTIVDDAVVTAADLGVNFFLEESCVGRPRAESTCQYLAELNPDVQGAYINDSISSLITTNPTFITDNGVNVLLLCSPLPTAIIHNLQHSYPEVAIFNVYSLGFLASLRISLPELCIVETHPDSLVDLRLYNPWPELEAYAEDCTRDIETMNEHQHGHIPYLVLLLYYLDQWKKTHNGELPTSYKDKNEFKKLILAGMRTDVPGGSEENFEEAVAAVMNSLRPHVISSWTQEVLQDESCRELNRNSNHFWIIARAVMDFVSDPQQGNGQLPLSGAVPDMKAESRDYVRLQNLYRQKAAHDVEMVTLNVTRILAALELPPTEISQEEIALWCKHANFVRMVRYRSLAQEWEVDEHHAKAISTDLMNNPDSLTPIYIALRAYQSFLDTTFSTSSPATVHPDLPTDVPILVSHAHAYLQRVATLLSSPPDFLGEEAEQKIEQWIQEIVRYGGAEIHNIASMAGGIVAQEVIKVCTRQYVPVNNTTVLDGVGSKIQCWEL